jgi:hypothetical protein
MAAAGEKPMAVDTECSWHRTRVPGLPQRDSHGYSTKSRPPNRNWSPGGLGDLPTIHERAVGGPQVGEDGPIAFTDHHGVPPRDRVIG